MQMHLKKKRKPQRETIRKIQRQKRQTQRIAINKTQRQKRQPQRGKKGSLKE